jgi:vancomycin resistance protein YoaR
VARSVAEIRTASPGIGAGNSITLASTRAASPEAIWIPLLGHSGIIFALGKRLSDLEPLTRAVVVGLAAVLLVMIGGFSAFRVLGAGSVLGDVRLIESELGGLSELDAAEVIDDTTNQLLRTPLLLDIDGRTTEVTGEQVGGGVEPGLIDSAMQNGRSGSVVSQFFWWVGSIFAGPVQLNSGFAVNPSAVDQLADTWDIDLIGSPPFPGAIEIIDGTAIAEYPRPGTSIERSGLVEIITNGILSGASEPVSVPTITTVPGASDRDLDAAAARANLWISNAITLTTPEGTQNVVFNPIDLVNAFRAVVGMDGTIELGFDEAIVDSFLLNQRDLIETAPVDARFEIDGYDVVIVPGSNGTLIDSSTTVATLEALADTSSRRGPLPVEEGAEPEVTTEELEALGIEHMVVQFTTYHDCCAARVTNIQLMADTIDGAILGPGEVFGINEYVGQRTLENGYLDAGTIVRGEIVETVGGGVSQFATTLYNTVFWGGYEDVQHKPHSFYFSRYPEGIESTVSFPQPEMSFRNNTDRSIMIKTSYTDTSITVKIFGANDGRIIAGAQRDGTTSFETIAEGGPNAMLVRGSVSERTDFTEPTTEYRPNPELTPGTQVETQKPRQGWTVFVTRTIEQAGASTEQTWTVRYLAQRQILEVHPCEVPNSGVTCPTTTTLPPSTTVPPESTTSAP